MKTTTCWMLLALALIGLMAPLSHPARGADPSPTTKPDAASPDAKRLTFLGDQLSADEAAIKAINRALIQAGYHAAVANDKAADAANDNHMMDRKGGAPVPWQQFYGRTAKDFIMHDKDSPVYHQVGRPDQFNYVYRANDNQIEAEKAEIDALGKKVDKLLARRSELETEQSSLWATIAFLSIGNRDIPLRPLYRDELKAKPSLTDDNRPDRARETALRAAIFYLRTVAHTTEVLSDSLETDQESAYTTLRDTLQKATDQLTESAATFSDTAGVDPAEAKQMSDVASQAKQIQSLCKDICEAFRKAKDADSAGEGEEQRKLLYRGTLQDSLFTFAEAVGQLDDMLGKMSETWEIHGQAGVKSSDQPVEVTGEATHSTPAPLNSAIAPATVAPLTTQEPQGEQRVDLLKLADPMQDARAGTWTRQEGALVSAAPNSYATIEFPYEPSDEYDYRLSFVRSQSNVADLQIICFAGGRQFAWVINESLCGFGLVDGRQSNNNRSTTKTDHPLIQDGKPCIVMVKVRKSGVEVYIENTDVPVSTIKTDYRDMSLHPKSQSFMHARNTIALTIHNQTLTLKSAEVIEITGEGKLLRAAAEPSGPAQFNSTGEARAPTGTEPRAAQAPQAGRRIDLLKMVDPTKDAVSGNWTMNSGILAGGSVNEATIEFPYVPPVEYDYRIVFKAQRIDDAIGPICCGAGHQFEWVISNRYNGLKLVDNKISSHNSTTNTNARLTNGQGYVVILKVRRDRVQAYLNDMLVISFDTDYGNLSLDKTLHHPDTIGLCMHKSDILVESAEVTEITGQGKLLRVAAGPDVAPVAAQVVGDASSPAPAISSGAPAAGNFTDRQIAEQVLKLGGKVLLRTSTGRVECDKPPLPDGSFTIITAILNGRKEVGDKQVEFLNSAGSVTNLGLVGTSISDATLQNVVSRMTALTSLNLNNTKVTDQGLKSLAGLTNLRRINIHNTSLSDAAIQQVLPNCRIDR